MKVLQVSGLTKCFGELEVLRGVSFDLEEGERVALMGPSGSGKSTLLNCIAGMDRADSGSIRFEGRLLDGLDEVERCALRRERIATIFQFFHLLPTLTARENIDFPLQLAGVDRRERKERVSHILEEVGMTGRADAMPDQLSGGESQRIAIARAVVIRPRLILGDEPTGNLDSRTGQTILQLLTEVSERHRIALLLVTHAEAVTRICHRTLHLHDGRIGEPAL